MSKKPITVSILATPHTTASNLYGLFDLFNSVGFGWENIVFDRPADPKFEVRIVAAEGKPFLCAGNVPVSPHCSVEDVPETDIALVASMNVPTITPPKNHDERELIWLKQQHSRGAIIAAACTGAIMLAETGLLDGCEATLHWAYREMFQNHYPEVLLRINENLCVSGQDSRIVTSGGATAWEELALYLVTQACGVEQAAQTAKFWLIPYREESQAPFAVMNRTPLHDDGVIQKCQEWMAGHYENPNPVAAMIEQSGFPPTTFARRFKQATGYRAMDYVHTLRVEEAKEMLENGMEAIDKIGRDVGYEDPASFRRIFKRKVSLTPSSYRRRFGRRRFETFEMLSRLP